ncbi:MAG TPA: electron transfer flavoprotein subunit alpha/FixB family protein [Terriglobia bacterium]|nr:electron transfer flavoprotein subunit alpha/FixB family protein [Terriglobia bacterium]
MSGEVLVFAEHQAGRLARTTFEAVAAAQSIAASTGGTVAAVILGSAASGLAPELAALELDQVVTVDSPQLQTYTADGYALALRVVIERRKPQVVVFSHTYLARDFAPKLAVALGRELVSDCLGYRDENHRLTFVRQVFQGKFNADVEVQGEPPFLVSFQAGAFREDAARRGEAAAKTVAVSIDIGAASIRTKPGERFREAKQAVDLTQAGIIVAAGRGIRAPENLELVKKLADVLGGEVGASRPICDAGWLPMDRQIGSSGQTVAPKLYFALGISGAIQHQVGMKGSKTIVAINKDREAPIFESTTYGVVGDLFEVVPPLIEEIQKIKG